MKKTKRFIAALTGAMLVLSTLAGCGSAASDPVISNSVSTSTEVSVSVSVSGETVVSTEASVSDETSASVDSQEKEEISKDFKAVKRYYDYSAGSGELTLAYDVEYDEYGHFIRHFSIGDCADEMPYTAVRSEEDGYIVYTFTYDTTGFTEEAIEAYKSWNPVFEKYDSQDHLVQVLYQDGSEVKREWDDNGNLLYYENRSNREIYKQFYTYDEHGNLLCENIEMGGTSYLYEYTYDENDRLLTETSRYPYGTYVTHNTYDERGNQVISEYSSNDGYGNRIESEHDEEDRLIHQTNKNSTDGRITAENFYEYDSNGYIVKTVNVYFTDDGAEETRYEYYYDYDEKGREIGRTSACYNMGVMNEELGESYVAEYDANGSMIYEKYESEYYSYEHRFVYTYDEDGYVLSIEQYIDGELFTKEEYTYFD